MLQLSSSGLFCIGCYTAGLGAGEAEDLGQGLKTSVIMHPIFMNVAAKNNSSCKCRLFFIGVKRYFKGLGVASIF